MKQTDIRTAAYRAWNNPRLLCDFLFGREFLSKSHNEGPLFPKEIQNFVGGVTDHSNGQIISEWVEFRNNRQFRESIEDCFNQTNTGPNKLYHNWRELLYLLVRILKPAVVVETGVGNGLSSAYIVAALEENSEGSLHSIDIGDRTFLPAASDSEIGWLVPEYLRHRWNLHVGDARNLLDEQLDARRVDLFFSDTPNELLEHDLQKAVNYMREDSVIMTSFPTDTRHEKTWYRYTEQYFKQWKVARRAYYQQNPSKSCAGVIG